jgi:signal peptidase I
LPNEKVNIVDGNVYINDILLDESLYTINGTTETQDVIFPIILKDDEYLCLGDNRAKSLDSRNSQTGLINKDDIFGIVFIVLRNLH